MIIDLTPVWLITLWLLRIPLVSYTVIAQGILTSYISEGHSFKFNHLGLWDSFCCVGWHSVVQWKI